MEPLNIISLKYFIQVGKKVGHQSNLLEYEHILQKKKKETCPQIQFASISKVTLERRKRKLLIQGVRHFRCLPYIIIIHTKDREKERKRFISLFSVSLWGEFSFLSPSLSKSQRYSLSFSLSLSLSIFSFTLINLLKFDFFFF